MEMYASVLEHPNVEKALSLDGRIIASHKDNENKVTIDSLKEFNKLI